MIVKSGTYFTYQKKLQGFFIVFEIMSDYMQETKRPKKGYKKYFGTTIAIG